MFRCFGLVFTLSLTLLISACSAVHTQLGPESPTSELRAMVEAPVDVAVQDVACLKPVSLEQQHKLIMISRIADPFSASLYFELNQIELIPESAAQAAELYSKFVKLKPKQVRVVGHTDTSATNAYNEALSLKRAMKVKQDLMRYGIAEEIIEVSADGETNLEIFTPDNTVEVRNRRVEIIAR